MNDAQAAAARVPKSFPFFRYKCPVVSARQQRQLQHSEGFSVADFAVRVRGAKGPVIFSARPHHEFADSAARIRFRLWSLWRESSLSC